MKRSFPTIPPWRLLLLMLPAGLPLHAQWRTETFQLKAGWNAVYLHVDASHQTLDELVGADVDNPILEIWKWQPSPTARQFVQSPQQPDGGDTRWLAWVRFGAEPQGLNRLQGNAAYLVRVAVTHPGYTWSVRGRPLVPDLTWTTTGLNFLGFPTVVASPPDFETFFGQVPQFLQHAEIYQYTGGDLAENPSRVFRLRGTAVRRGEAFWMRAGDWFNRYHGPFALRQLAPEGLAFGDQLGALSFRLRNLTAGELTVTGTLRASEPAPPGQPAIAGTPPLLIRGPRNLTDLTYGYTRLEPDTPFSWTLAAAGQEGSEAEVVVGVDRTAMGGAPGDLFAGILELTDSLGHTRVDVGVTASPASRAGLWVGHAAVTHVAQYLTSYQRDQNGNPVIGPDGRHVITGVNQEMAPVPTPFKLRLIVHNPETGPAILLQRVFLGSAPDGRQVVSTREGALDPDRLAGARRISAVHLPWTADNTGWSFDGPLEADHPISVLVPLDHTDQASNPFLHTYHPDHDNLDPDFEQELPRGVESYAIERRITLSPAAPPDDFDGLTRAARTLQGVFSDTIRLLGLQRTDGPDQRTFATEGTFLLQRVSAVPSLTVP